MLKQTHSIVMKKCKSCLELKSPSAYYKLSKSRSHIGDGLQAQCKECVKAFHRSEASRKKARSADKIRFKNNPEARKKAYESSKKSNSTPEAKAKNAIRSKKWAKDNKEKLKELRKKYNFTAYRKTKSFKDSIIKYRKNNPEKRQAQIKVASAISSGKLTRPERCSYCKSLCKPEGHHTNYSKPLDVIWLCKQCHENHHHNSL